MKKCKCLNCGMSFNSKQEKQEHKKKYPDASCKGKFNDVQIMKSERDKTIESSIPEAESISMSEDEAKRELKEYRELLKSRKESYLKNMKDALVQLSKGRKIIDINEVMKKAGVREDGFPKLAIARADGRKVYLHRHDKGRARFTLSSSKWEQYVKDTIFFQEGIFPEFKKGEKEQYNFEIYETLVPIIPAVFMPKGKLDNYWILWEVDDWVKSLVPPRDPILLKRISETTFAILAVWDLTPLERSIVGSRA